MPQFLCAACIDAADYGIVQVSTWWRLLSRLVQFMHPSWAHPDNTLGCTACAVSISARSKRPVVVHIGATMLCRVLFVVQGSHIYIYIYITVIRPKKPFVQTLEPRAHLRKLSEISAMLWLETFSFVVYILCCASTLLLCKPWTKAHLREEKRKRLAQLDALLPVQYIPSVYTPVYSYLGCELLFLG